MEKFLSLPVAGFRGISKINLELLWLFLYFSGMKSKSKKQTGDYENVKLPAHIVLALRVNKEKTGVSMTAFLEQAVVEKFKRQNGK